VTSGKRPRCGGVFVAGRKEKPHRQDAGGAKEKKSFTAKELIIRSKATPEAREGTAPRVAYREHFRI
jgi:hypothetical protein